jgi:hypothetical protein
VGWTVHDTDQITANTVDNLQLTMDVGAGDLIVVMASVLEDGVVELTGVTDGNGNSYTLGTTRAAGTQVTLRIAYAIAGSTNPTLTITAAFTAGTYRKNLWVGVFRPDAGDTIEFDTSAYKQSSYEASPDETAAFDTVGNDELCVACIQGTAATYSNQEIPSGTAAVVIGSQVYGTAFYNIFTSSKTGIIAETDASTSQYYVAQLVAFKATEAGGAGKKAVYVRAID